ncbi:peptide-methionine (S)-S-oxide reductase MsrA [Promethearchaeum syntrophicum]|uniref:Peptide methionine sulfoxide reductase MsrA n=1 Tax=Promethearchaeum syntrophicum TaxID=2594042 RepID=A0A5B9D5B2_9ARCH|nr:peptide-methionine (S)-S-oxide reductase MsrA [Candidatus Prometheoarchaeum syntrophicum]QEE14242.1 methionine sulfoxide reductase A [Candidatus Prometheoarchaeum syntrophicum]
MTREEKATFAAGCFWGVEYMFSNIKGVVKTEVGYTGGTTKSPTYQQVCTRNTGHAEAVDIIFDPSIISYEELLYAFFKNHDPTTPNRQGVDVGSQYRSAIFYHTQEQSEMAKSVMNSIEKTDLYSKPIVTQIVAATQFYPAEEYHQKYFEKNGMKGCSVHN